MTADDYVGVILGTFTFFLWALIVTIRSGPQG